MFKPLSLFLGLRYVRTRQGNGFSSFISASSTIGIALGVMVLIVVLSAMNGFERELAQRLLSVVPHAEIVAVDQPISDWPAQIKQVQKHEGVLMAAPVIKLTAMMQKGTQLKGLEVRGVDIELEAKASAISDLMIAGQWRDLANINMQKNNANRYGVIIGSGIAKKLNVNVGDSVQILMPQQGVQLGSYSTPDETHNLVKKFSTPIKRNVEVVGIFKFGGTIDDTLAYMSLKDMSEMMDYKAGEVQGIRLTLKDVFDAPRIAREVAYEFNTYVYIYDWTRTQGHVYNDIQLVRLVMLIVLVLVIAVASFNIVSTLIMAVNDKKGDIAILKTMGANPSMIMMVFMFQGIMNGVLGCLIGAVLGVYIATYLTEIIVMAESFLGVKFLSADVYFIDYIPTEINDVDVYITVITALVMSLFATIYPAWRATKVEPAQVLGQC